MVHDSDFHRIDEGRLRSNQIALGVFIFQDYPKKSSDQVVCGHRVKLEHFTTLQLIHFRAVPFNFCLPVMKGKVK